MVWYQFPSIALQLKVLLFIVGCEFDDDNLLFIETAIEWCLEKENFAPSYRIYMNDLKVLCVVWTFTALLRMIELPGKIGIR